MDSSTCRDGLISLPCSSHVYQVTLTPERNAISSRRRPRSGLRAIGGRPESARTASARPAVRKTPSSSRLSDPCTLEYYYSVIHTTSIRTVFHLPRGLYRMVSCLHSALKQSPTAATWPEPAHCCAPPASPT